MHVSAYASRASNTDRVFSVREALKGLGQPVGYLIWKRGTVVHRFCWILFRRKPQIGLFRDRKHAFMQCYAPLCSRVGAFHLA